MPFYSTALVLSDGEEQVAILTWTRLDSIKSGRTGFWTRSTALTGFPRDRIRFSCTHTHSGPNTFRLGIISEGLDMVQSYLDALPHRIASAVWQAQQNMKPVRVAAGKGTCDINVNRRFRAPDGSMVVGRNWNGAVDRTVGVVRFDDMEENPVATILHYACHGTTIGWQTELFTPDFPGPAREVVEREVGGTVSLPSRSNREYNAAPRVHGRLRVYRRLGTILGLEAAKVAWSIETLQRQERFIGVQPSGAPIALYDDVPVETKAGRLLVVQKTLQLPAKKFRPPAELEADVSSLRAEVNRLRKDGTPDQIRVATAAATQAGWRAEYSRNYYGKDTVPWELMIIALGASIALRLRPRRALY